MTWKFWESRGSVYDEPISMVLKEMHDIGPENERYPKLVVQLDRLNEMKAKAKRFRVSGDTLAIVGGNLAIALIIVAFERDHPWVSKAANQIKSPNPPQNYS